VDGAATEGGGKAGKRTANPPAARCVVRRCAVAKRDVAPLGASPERPGEQLPTRGRRAASCAHAARHEPVESAQLGEGGPDALGLVVTLAGREDAAALRHPQHLAQGIPRGVDVDQHLMAKGDVERLVGKGELVDGALPELDVFDAGRFGHGSCSRQDGGAEVDAGDVAVGEELGEAHGDGAGAGAGVEELQAGVGLFHGPQRGQQVGGAALGGPHLVQGRLGGRVVWLLAGRLHFRNRTRERIVAGQESSGIATAGVEAVPSRDPVPGT